MPLLELACFNVTSAMYAEASGADRIELCARHDLGGITPDEKDIIEVKKKVNLPLHVMIRPRGGDFVYDDDDLRKMKESIRHCKKHGVDGVVFGMLDSYSEINEEAVKEFMRLSHPMQVTFHRAIDKCFDTLGSVERLVELGVDRVLTSGKAPAAMDGLGKLLELNTRFGNKIIIMPGGGIRAGNIQHLLSTGCREYHSSAITGAGDVADPFEIRLLKRAL